MTNLINVASRAPMALHIAEPISDEFRDRPGAAPEPKRVTIAGNGGPDRAEVITRGVDADLFKKWMEANANTPIVENGLLREVSDDEAKDAENPKLTFGFEPGLEAAADDHENVKLAEKGSQDAPDADLADDVKVELKNDTRPEMPVSDRPVAPSDGVAGPETREAADAQGRADLRGGPVVHGDSPVAAPVKDASKPAAEPAKG